MQNKEKATPSKTGVEIIFEFKDSLNSLIHFYGLYVNLLSELKAINPDMEKLEDGKKAEVRQYCQEIRYHATISYIKYCSMFPSLKLEENKTIKEKYTEIKETFLVKEQTVSELIIELNKILVNEIIQELLKSNKDLITDAYNKNGDTGH